MKKYISLTLINALPCHICFTCLCLFSFLGAGVVYAEDVLSHNIPADYIIAGNLNHELGQRWLKARGLKDQGEFDLARHQYVLLLDVYPDLIQARFEYVQVLFTLGRFGETEIELESLLELEPTNLDYKQFLGMLFLDHGQEQQGVLLLEDVWRERQEPFVGERLYHAYTKYGQQQKSLNILEYLYKQSDNDELLQKDLFILYIALGDDLNAQNFAPSPSAISDVSLTRLIQAALLHERLGLEHLAADYWHAVLKKQPDYKLAHENLATYYMENSRDEEALPHNIFLYSHTDNNGAIAGEIGDYYVRVSECPQAIFFLKRSLAENGLQVDRLRKLAFCYKNLGLVADAADVFRTYFLVKEHPSLDDLLVAAKVFDDAFLPIEAAHQYRQILVQTPGDVDILVALAEVETRRGDFNEALFVWKQVARRKPNDVTCRIQILLLSEKLGLSDVSLVLAEIHALDQNNHRVSLLLALEAFERGDFPQGMKLFQPLAKREFFSADLLALRGEIFLLLNQPQHSFADLHEALKVNPALSEKYVLALVEVAGALGRLDLLLQLDGQYLFSGSSDLNIVLLYANGLAESGEFSISRALYTKIIDSDQKGLHSKARHGLATLYQRYDFNYEAEQEDRLNWLTDMDQDALVNLVYASLRQENNGEAEFWLDQYLVHGLPFNPAIYRAEIRLLIADDEFERAFDFVNGFEQMSSGSAEDCSSARLLIQLDEIEMLFRQGQFIEAFTLISVVQERYPEEIRPLVCKLRMHILLDESAVSTMCQDELLDFAGGDAGDLFELQRLAGVYELNSFSRLILRKLHKAHPKSLKYGLAFIAALIDNSSFDEAADVISRLHSMYPNAVLLNLYGGKVSLAKGDFAKGLLYVNQIAPATLFSEQLLRARILWGLHRWDDALKTYDQNLLPSAEYEFDQELEILNVTVPDAPDPSLWLRIVKPMASSKSPLEDCFTPMSNGDMDLQYTLIGTTFFAKKRWQDYLTQELAARRSVRKREYFHAVNQFEAMGEQLVEPTLLFDLAGVYSSLNRVGDEAVVYDKINRINPDFPGLTSAMNRNQLRRRPRTGVMVQYYEEDGFAGYKDISLWKQEGRAWYSPKPRREGFLSASLLYYNGEKGESISGNELLMGVTSNVFDYFKLDLAGGVHLLEDDHPNKGIFDIGITGMAGDFLQSSLRVKKRMVQDTLASLGRGITVQEYTAQATVDLLPRLHVGGSLVFADYSDDNDMSGYSLWGLLILQTQPDYVFVRAGYEFTDHKNGAGGSGVLLDDGFREDDHPYWAPINYWRNQYTLGYKHTYSDDIIGHQIPGFLSCQYSVEYDSEGELFHYLATGVHFEISESWLFSFNGSLDFADEYDGLSLDTTLEYRW